MGQPMHIAGEAVEHDTVPSDDEWEYEYDATETEDYYFTLDLTTHVPKPISAPPSKANQGAEHDSAAARGGGQAASAAAIETSLNEDDIDAPSAHQVQITDLHTQSPLVRFDAGIYNCYWSTDLGTQFHISQAGATSTPRRSGTTLDIVGTSQTRLIAKPAELVPRLGRRRLDTLGKNMLHAIPVNDDSDAEGDSALTRTPQPISATAVPGEPLKISRESCKSSAAEAQASFLERLSAIKLKKGEMDQVPVFTVRIYDPPENADELRKTALAKDAETARRRKELEGQARERNKRRRLTNAERGIPGTDSPSAAGRKSRGAINESLGFEEPSEAPFIASRPSTHSSTTGSTSKGVSDLHAEGEGAPNTANLGNEDGS